MRNFRLWQQASVVSLLAPASDGAGRVSAFELLANTHKAFIVCYINQGSATPVTLIPLQAQSVAGAGAKGLKLAAQIAVNLDCDTVPSDMLTVAAPAFSYTTDAALKTKLVLFEIDPISQLDTASSPAFSWLAISTSPSNAANITSAFLLLMPLRYAQQHPPSATAPSSGAPAIVAPGAVQNLASSAVTATGGVITWAPPATGGTPSTYLLEISSNGGVAYTTVSASAISPFTVIGLTARETVIIRVSAQNAAGYGPTTTTSFTTTASSGGSTDDSSLLLFGFTG